VESLSGDSIDFFEIDGASNRRIDEVREIRENVRYLPAHGRYKVYLIDEVHMLTEPAFNALLKTLEEPPPHVVFIFATTAPQKLPATILSRCQRYDFKRLPEEMIAAELVRICAAEGRELEPEAAALLAREAEGSMRDALSLLEQALAAIPANEAASAKRVADALDSRERALAGKPVPDRYVSVGDSAHGEDANPEITVQVGISDQGTAAESIGPPTQARVSDSVVGSELITVEDITKALGLIDRRLVSDAFAAVVNRDAARCLGIAAELHDFGQDAQQFCQLLLQQVRDALAARLLADRPEALPRLVRATPEELTALQGLAAGISQETLQLYFDILMEGMNRLRRASHPRLALEMTLLKLATLEPALPLEEILSRLARLEERLARQGSGAAVEQQQGLFGGPAEPAAPKPVRQAAPARPQPPSDDGPKPQETTPVRPAEAPEPEEAPEPKEAPESAAILERVRAFAQERDGILFAALGGATLEGRALTIPPGFFAPDDLKRRAQSCLESLGLPYEVRLAQAAAAAASEPTTPRRATLQDVYDIFGGKPAKER